LSPLAKKRLRASADGAKGKSTAGRTAFDKLRGGYYTPRHMASWLCAWAIRAPGESILEPSCGEGVFLDCAAERLAELGVPPRRAARQLMGLEIVAAEAEKARRRLARRCGSSGASVLTEDFFDWHERNRARQFDCAVGNPPFIRYQNFPEPSRSVAMKLMKRLGLRANRLTNIWVPFVVGATVHLAPGGRLAMVLPAELLQVSYASQLRSFLARHFSSIDILACNQLLFDLAEQEVLLVLADGKRQTPSTEGRSRIDLREVRRLDNDLLGPLRDGRRRTRQKRVNHDSEKWLKYFLTPAEISLMRRLRASPEIGDLGSHAAVDVGVVTGRNAFFVISIDEIERLGLDDHVVPIVGRSSQLKGAVLSAAEWRELAARGERVFLFHMEPGLFASSSKSARDYIAFGETRGYHKGYKCAIREPWYCVPGVWEPDCFFFRQIYDFPRVVANRADATSTDTIHRVRCNGNRDLLLTNVYTHLTAASAEIEGRSYGGGVLELEPTEAERVLVPGELRALLSPQEVDGFVRRGKLDDLLGVMDEKLLVDGLGLSRRECSTLKRIWSKLRDRRRNRKRRPAR